MNSTKKISWAWMLVLLIICGAGLGSLCAQEKPSVPARPVSNDNDAAQQPRGPGRRLVHESREAAGEDKDPTAEFKQSASVKIIARMTGLSLQQSYWLSMVVNFAVIIGVFVWAGRKYLPTLFRNRTAAIQKAMQEAQKASEEARRKLSEIETRLQRLDVEIGEMRESAAREGAAEEARIRAAAEEDARKIIAAAEQEIAAAVKAARRQLTAHAADLAVALAQKQIRVDAATDQALVRGFAGQLASASDNSVSDRSGRERN